MASIVDYVIAIREIAKTNREKRKKDALYRVLVGSELNYLIIKDLVTAARNDVLIDITLKDGSRLEIKPTHPIDVEKPPKTDLY